MRASIDYLKNLALTRSLRSYKTLSSALKAMKFVQYDPIEAPLRAQDLILFQRVDGYKPKDLDVHYKRSLFEEDYLHVYGIVDKKIQSLLYPRAQKKNKNKPYVPEGLSREVYSLVCSKGPIGSKDVAKELGSGTVLNDWGGKSQASTQALEELHYFGFLRVGSREKGIKVYDKANIYDHDYCPAYRLIELTKIMLNLLAPVSHAGLTRAISQLRRASSGLDGKIKVIDELLKREEIRSLEVEGVKYYLPIKTRGKHHETSQDEVRFLAPFDPVVWDRNRFNHLWGWEYRLEAYTPKHLRQYGYYALPLFWGNRAIGWVNLTRRKDRAIEVHRGFIEKAPLDRAFEQAFDKEMNRFLEVLS